MPIYEYTCKSCKKKFEQLIKSMSSSAAVKCPDCGSGKTARSMSVFAVSAQGATKSAVPDSSPMCGRCGGPGPCAMN